MTLSSLKAQLRPLYAPVSNWLYAALRGPKRYHHLYDAIQATRASSILEIGVWSGERASAMLRLAKKYSLVVRYYGFDLFEDLNEVTFEKELSKHPPKEADVRARLEETGAEIHLFRGNTLETLPKVAHTLPPMDVIFIDGGHSLETIKNDWEHVAPLMHERTVVIFDDYWQNRTDGGCKVEVDNLDRTKYQVELSSEVDVFDHETFGRLEIRFAKVTLR